MATTHGWRKSTYSREWEHCVEFAPTDESVLVRDTKDHGAGPILAFPRTHWAAFLAAVRGDEFD